MSENLVVGIPSDIVHRSIREFIGLKRQSKSEKILQSINSIMAKHSIDDETSLAIFKSFGKYSDENADALLSRFENFVSNIKDRDMLISTVKSLGMVSKAELEEQAQATGNWLPLIKRTSKEAEDAHKSNAV